MGPAQHSKMKAGTQRLLQEYWLEVIAQVQGLGFAIVS